MKHFRVFLVSSALTGVVVAQDVETVQMSAALVDVQYDYPWRIELPDGSAEMAALPVATLRIAQPGACQGKEVRVLFDQEMTPMMARLFSSLSQQSQFSLRLSPDQLLVAAEEILQTSDEGVDVVLITGGVRPVRRPVLDDPETIARFSEYARRLIDRMDWPLELEDPITVSGDGYRLAFRTTIGPEDACGYTSRQAASIRRLYPDYLRDWQATVCMAELREPVSEETFTARLMVYAGGHAIGSIPYDCDASAAELSAAERWTRAVALKPASYEAGNSPAFREYAELLIEKSGWPIVFDDVLRITSGSGGLMLRFVQPDIDASDSGASSSGMSAFASLTYEDKSAHWQAAFCGPAVMSLIGNFGLFGATVIYNGGTGFSAQALDCLAPEDLEYFQRVQAVRTTLDRWQWSFSGGEASAAEFREDAERIEVEEVWPYVRDDDAFGVEFRNWLEQQVLSR